MQTYGLVIEFRYEPLGSGKVLECKVNTGERPTNWLRVKSNASLSLIEHIPMRINDLVVVVSDDDSDDGFVDRNIPYKETVLPNDIDENIFYKKFEDGTIYKHNVKTKKIILDTPCDISITTAKNINVECNTSNVKAAQVNIDSSDINNGLGGTGVQTDDSVCNLTGLPCSNGSSTVKATM
ncbi:MAG: hypothetical protein JJV95_04455 [Sulfurospirillum sp.]|nr:hypothetical protein [Sulfurospirillum sp.]